MHPAFAAALAFLAPVGIALSKTALNILISLASETFVRRALVHAVEKLAKKTATDWDNQLAVSLRATWDIKD